MRRGEGEGGILVTLRGQGGVAEEAVLILILQVLVLKDTMVVQEVVVQVQ
jgi:hypothetical protein